MPRRKPGPKPEPKPQAGQGQRRKHTKHFDFPLLTNFVDYQMRPQEVNTLLTNAYVFSTYKKWIMRMGRCVLPDQLRQDTYNDEHSAAFMRQLLTHPEVRKYWNVKRKEGTMHLVQLQKSSLPGWSLSLKSFISVEPRLKDLPIVRKPSTLGTLLDQGMFSTRTIFEGEIICEYQGTIQEVTGKELELLEIKHQNDGNGILQMTHTATTSHKNNSSKMCSKRKIMIMNPYIYKNEIRTCATSPGVWANHCPRETTPGSNMKLITNDRSGFNKRTFFQARSLIPPDVELRWDYGIRDPAIPWTLP